MARALIVGCGCRGRDLGLALAGRGWQVRGTSRDPNRAGEIETAGIEPAIGDPDRLMTLVDHLAEVTLVYWLLGSVEDSAAADALHGPRLERFLEAIVDTPVRGFVYEAEGSSGQARLDRGAGVVREAGARWRIPVEVVGGGSDGWEGWRERMLAAAERLVGPA